jgi:hypothetical protein
VRVTDNRVVTNAETKVRGKLACCTHWQKITTKSNSAARLKSMIGMRCKCNSEIRLTMEGADDSAPKSGS